MSDARTITVGAAVVDALAQAGVKRIYGVVGDSLNHVTDALRKDGRIRWVHVRHEEVGALAAGAEAQLSGELACCAGSSGPGNLHLINGLYDAHRSQAPVIAIASHILQSEVGTSYFQETHPDQLFRECSHYCELIANPSQAPRILESAIRSAVSRRGVGVVVLPGDVAAQPVKDDRIGRPLAITRPAVRPSDADLGRLAEMIDAAGTVTLFCGAGCAGAREQVIALAEKLRAPVGHAWRGKQWVEPDNPYDVGMTGLLGFGGAYDAIADCDLLLLLGTDFPYRAFLETRGKIAQIDLAGERLGRRAPLDLGLVGDIRQTLDALHPMVQGKSETRHLDAAREKFADTRKKLDAYVDHVSGARPLHPEFVTAAIDELADDDAVFTVDTGLNCVWAARHIQAKRDRRIIGSFNHGSMATAMPQAIGAQMLYPDRQIVALCGDGGFSMLMGDLLTVAQYDLPLKIVVYDNGALGFINLEMRSVGLPEFETDLKNPDFSKLAEAVGIMGVRIEDPADVGASLAKALSHPGPALIDVVTDPNVLSLPPKITLSQVEGFALGMSRLALSGHVDAVLETIEANWRLR